MIGESRTRILGAKIVYYSGWLRLPSRAARAIHNARPVPDWDNIRATGLRIGPLAVTDLVGSNALSGVGRKRWAPRSTGISRTQASRTKSVCHGSRLRQPDRTRGPLIMPAGSAKLGQQPRDRTGNTLSGADLEATKLPS